MTSKNFPLSPRKAGTMKRISMLFLLFAVMFLASCSSSSGTLYSSDAEFERFVRAKYAEKSPDAKLSSLTAMPLKSDGDIDKREFSATTDGDVKVTGYMSYDKKNNKSSFQMNFEYPK